MANCLTLAGTTVGKRYARTDELGVPFGITVDGQTAEDSTVTVRERDSTKQVMIGLGVFLPCILSGSKINECHLGIFDKESVRWASVCSITLIETRQCRKEFML